MKTIFAVILLGIVMWIGVVNYNGETIEYVKEEATLEVVEEPTVEVDVIDRARQELERINIELDAKEQELLEKRKGIDSELEKLRQTRISFQ